MKSVAEPIRAGWPIAIRGIQAIQMADESRYPVAYFFVRNQTVANRAVFIPFSSFFFFVRSSLVLQTLNSEERATS